MPRIGYLCPGPREVYADRVDAFFQGLRDLGYVEGETVSIERRFSPTGNTDARWPELVKELVALSVDIIVTESSTPAGIAAKQLTSTIPIVVVDTSFPVETGLVETLARPGGNVTALVGIAPGEAAKHVDLLRALAPGLTTVVDFVDVNLPTWTASWAEFRAAAESVGVDAQRIDLRSAEEVDAAFAFPLMDRAQALNISSGSLLFPVREHVAQLALQHHLPAITTSVPFVESGALMSYGTNIAAVSRRGAIFVDKILKGTRPADLPVELPTVFDFAVNVRTAQALGLTIPPDVAAQVTRWIQ
jgi:putative ABC transport system substrate-binding protein